MGGGGGNFIDKAKDFGKKNLSTIVNPIGDITNPLQRPIVKAAQSKIGGNQVDAPVIPGVSSPDYAGDQAQIDALGKQIRGLYGEQATAQNQAIDKQMQDMITNLTTGNQGRDLRNEYNRLGLLDSGAFNEALAQQFTPIQQNAQEAVLNQGLNQFGDLRNLASSGVERQFGLEDWMSNAQLQRMLAQSGANLSVDLANQQSKNDFINSLIGGGSRIAGGSLGKG